MEISANDVPLSDASATFSELAEAVKGGAETNITKNGDGYISLIYEATKGLEDVVAGRIVDARKAIHAIGRRRAV